MVIVTLVFGFILLIGGGELLVRAAVAFARHLGMPPLIIGLTIVAIGTSAPELVVAIQAMTSGAPDIVTGGVIGSNIANILLVLGITGLIAPIRSNLRMINRDGMFLVGVSALAAALALIGRIDFRLGAGMMAAYLLYIGYAYWSERVPQTMTGARPPGDLPTDDADDELAGIPRRFFIAIIMFALGLGGLLWGAKLLVDAAIQLARAIGISEAVIGLSVVAFGTSLPELAASVMAALRNRSDLALGNIVGSNITNILLVLGGASVIAPLTIAVQIMNFDVWVMLLATIILVPVLVSGQVLSRAEACFFIICYGIYIAAIYLGWQNRVLALF